MHRIVQPRPSGQGEDPPPCPSRSFRDAQGPDAPAEGRPRLSVDDIRRALLELQEGWKDADAVTSDLLKPARKRELGPILHQENYDAAREKIVAALADIIRAVGDESDPVGEA